MVVPHKLVAEPVSKQLLLVTYFRALHAKVSQKAMSLSGTEEGVTLSCLQSSMGYIIVALHAVQELIQATSCYEYL